MKTDDKLIADFFATKKKEVADNGFSRKVMENLPHKTNRLAQAWALFVTLVALVLFFVFDGLQGVITTLRDVFVFMVQQSTTSIDPYSLLIAAVVLLFLGICKVWTME